MSTSFDNAEARVIDEIKELTLGATRILRELWLTTFDMNTCELNINKLSEHVKLFYDEIVQETKDRQDTILKAIRDLLDEAANIGRLLNVDVDLSTPKDTPLHIVQIRMDEKLQELREKLKRRKDQVMELLLEQETLCEELNEMPRPLLDDPLPTEDKLGDFRLHLDALRAQKNNRMYLIASYRKDIKSFMSELEMPVRTDEEEYLLNDRSLPLSQHNVDRLQNLREQFVSQMEETRESIEKIKGKLEKIWDCINISPRTRSKFSKYTGYSQTTYDRFYRELNRCEAIKRQNIKLFVDKCREEIVLWWIKTMKSDAERSRFTHFTNDWYTEDLLALHEIELEELKRFYEENEQIFNLITERQNLWDRMEAFENKAAEPGRYNNRGGQLLKEEKERKQISTKLPKIEEQLKELVTDYEARHNRKFTVFGDEILEIIRLQWEEKRVKKEKHMSARKNAATPTHSRNISSIRTPMSLRNQMGSTMSSAKKLPFTPSMMNGSSIPFSSKRKLIMKDKDLPSSKRNLISKFEVQQTFKSPIMKKLKPVIGSTIKRKSLRLSTSSKKRRSRNSKSSKMIPKIKVNDETNLASSDATFYDNFEEYIHKEPASRSSIMHSNNSSAMSTRRNARNIENAAINKRNATTVLKMMRTPSKVQSNEQVSVVTKKDILSRSRAMSPATGSARKLTTKNLPIMI